ncbi:hypothetical protein PCAR4_570109 [Paraburkholderia caribensis]|nr:hypothetical protein PCAR4_570109 [Paraburkholderia caribensis]
MNYPGLKAGAFLEAPLSDGAAPFPATGARAQLNHRVRVAIALSRNAPPLRGTAGSARLRSTSSGR